MGIRELDLFIIGGGINGAGFARDAAGRGLKVALCAVSYTHLTLPTTPYV